MKLLVISDIHAKPNSYYGLKELLDKERPSLLLVLGDITNFGPAEFVDEFFSYIMPGKIMLVKGKDFPSRKDEKRKETKNNGEAGEKGVEEGVRIVAIRGNCDVPEVKPRLSALGIDGELSIHETQSHVILGIGGAPATPFGTPFEYDEEEVRPEIERLFEKASGISVKERKDFIVLSHAPPYGINDMVRGLHRGSGMLLEMCERYRPLLFLSGHIHEARGVEEQGGTLFVNPGPFKEGYYAVVEKKDKKYTAFLKSIN